MLQTVSLCPSSGV